jgi:Asp-tRNA(Asn)/Glu-tRNA(Gln) amidotransferase A subunit family amidase
MLMATFTPHTSLLELSAALRSGARPLLDYLDALEAYFAQRELELLAFAPEDGRFARLRRAAQQLLARYPDPARRPPLFGVPLGVKDIFHVDGFPTRAGCALPPDLFRGAEASSVTALRQAGALILGKTATTEFAYFAPAATRNPHNPAHTPGGSSSGSAAAVGAGLAPLALGTQTIGSISRPAAFCGVVGFKPSYDRIARAGVLPLAPGADHVGFFTPTAADAPLVAGLLCREWRPELADARSAPARPVLAIPAGPYLARASAEGQAHFQRVCRQLREAGCALKEVPALADFEAVERRHQQLVAAEAAQTHAAWFAAYGALYHPKTAELIRRGRQVSDAELAAARAARADLRRELDALRDAAGADLWIAPATVGAAPAGLASTGDPVMNLPWTHAGLPTLSLPAGKTADGLPLGLQLVGRWWGDEALLGTAVVLELLLGE